MWRTERKYNIPKSLFGTLPNGEETEFSLFYFIMNILWHINRAPSPTLMRNILNIINSDRNYNKPFPPEMLMTDTVNDGAGFEKYCDLVEIVRKYVFRCSEEKLKEIYRLIFPEFPARLISAGEDTVLLGDGKSKENIERTLKFIFLVFLWLLETHEGDFCRMYYYTFESLRFEDLFLKFPNELIYGKEKNTEKAKKMTLSLEGLLVHSNNFSLNNFDVDAKFVPPDFCYLRDKKMVGGIKNSYGLAKTNLECELLNSSTLPKELILMIVSNLFGDDEDVDLDTLLETVPFLVRDLFE
jgi:hypothetical protein